MFGITPHYIISVLTSGRHLPLAAANGRMPLFVEGRPSII
jgi:hypothetical protein